VKTSDLIFIGIRGSVVALNRATGAQVWAAHLKGSGFVNVVLDGDRILAASYGEVFCLNPITGEGRWHNPLKGYGLGLASIATQSNPGNGNAVTAAEMHRRDEEAAASSAAAASSVTTT
jgi:outer membrane protein assembly factor BamB